MRVGVRVCKKAQRSESRRKRLNMLMKTGAAHNSKEFKVR